MYAQCVLLITILALKYSLCPSYRANTRNSTDKYVEVFRLWVPLNKTTLVGYSGASVYQSLAICYIGGWTMIFDTTAMVSFFVN